MIYYFIAAIATLAALVVFKDYYPPELLPFFVVMAFVPAIHSFLVAWLVVKAINEGWLNK